MNKPIPKEILLAGVSNEVERLDELAKGLRRLGHAVFVALTTEDALGQRTPDILIVTEASGSSLFQAFRLPIDAPRGIFLSSSCSFDAAVLATQRGASQVLGTPTIDQLCDAVELQSECHQRQASSSLELSSVGETGNNSNLLELLAFTTQIGLGRSLRLRIVTAASEILSLARGPRTIRASLVDDPLGTDRLVLEVTSFEKGPTNQTKGAGPSSLDFAIALCDRVDDSTDYDQTVIRAEFNLAPANFEEDPAGLDELDYFDPACLRELHATLLDPEENSKSLHRLAPAATTLLMRIQTAGLHPETALFTTSAGSTI